MAKRKAKPKRRAARRQVRALWDASTPTKYFLAKVTKRPLASGFLHIPAKHKALFPEGDASREIQCVLQNFGNPEVLLYSPRHRRITGGLTEWYREMNVQPDDQIRIEVLQPRARYRLALVREGQEREAYRTFRRDSHPFPSGFPQCKESQGHRRSSPTGAA